VGGLGLTARVALGRLSVYTPQSKSPDPKHPQPSPSTRPPRHATPRDPQGIDKPNCRRVIHWGVPASLEAYFQQAGRAGRDGLAARCELMWTQGDFTVRCLASGWGCEVGVGGWGRQWSLFKHQKTHHEQQR